MSGQASWLLFAALGGSLKVDGWAKKSSSGGEGAMAVRTASSIPSYSTSLRDFDRVRMVTFPKITRHSISGKD
jgi:hypothetical protein